AAAPARLVVKGERGAGSGTSVVLTADEPARPRPPRAPLWHQFRVLTARYAELLWGDRRSLRLLWLQAPAVAAILLVGFVNKPFQATLPYLRNLTSDEKNVLLVLKGVEQDLATEKDGKPGGAGDSQVTVSVDKLGQKQSIKVAEVRQWLKQLDELPSDSPERKTLEEVQIEVSSGGAK